MTRLKRVDTQNEALEARYFVSQPLNLLVQVRRVYPRLAFHAFRNPMNPSP